MSIAGIVELSPSFRSVENALGLGVSYNVTENYKMHLISEREKAVSGAWDTVSLQDDSFPLCQFDNWDLLPVNAVKADGKAMPKVNGSLVQGVIRKRKIWDATWSNETKRRKLKWKDPSTLGTRTCFANRVTTPENNKTVEHFFEVVFSVVATHQDQLAYVNDTCGSSDRVEKSGRSMMHFRRLMLSAFLPHGGAKHDEDLYDQQVVYADISREPASDVLTLRQMLDLIRSLIRPEASGCPKFVVVSGDQPSYKMLVELWLKSWRNREHSATQETYNLHLHEWMVPFPGFFYAEKQAMYSLCKEALDVVGLAELAECAGLSPSQVRNILKHNHARNNRAFLFSLACALVIHAIDKVTEKDPELGQALTNLNRNTVRAKSVSTEEGRTSGDWLSGARNGGPTSNQTRTGLFAKTTPFVSDEVLELGTKLRKAVQSQLCTGPNGQHFIETVLFGALLPTVGFHVLSRTGHTDLSEPFWFRLRYMLHSSNHLKYQELSLFYAFMRGVLPPAVVSELHKDASGSSVMKLPSFTSSDRFMVGPRGWTYVHLDELLEMLMVRHLKSLSVNLLSHMENAASWLMQVSYFRSIARRITGASRAYGRFRDADDAGEGNGPLRFYDRNAPQSRSVGVMLGVMRESGFLNESHRGSEGLTNVFSTPPRRMGIASDQSSVLGINEYGKTTTALHSSVLFPDVFGALRKQDRNEHLGGKKFKRWSSFRRVKTLVSS